MGKLNTRQHKLMLVILASVAIITGCGNSSTTGASSLAGTTTSTTSSSTTLTISPSTLSLAEGASYQFTASGGSGSYTYSIPGGGGTVDASTGIFLAPSNWTGTTYLQVLDSSGSTTYATVSVTTASSGGTTTGSTVLSMTGTLTNCAGVAGGSFGINNWQVNGTELRTINDPNYFTESPVLCTGLSVAGTIPSTATILGVSVSIFLVNQSSNTDGSYLQSLALINSSSIIGAQSTLSLLIPGKTATFPTFTQGGSTNTWGASLTPAIINSSSFGIDIQTYRGLDRLFVGQTSTIAPQMTIYYSL